MQRHNKLRESITMVFTCQAAILVVRVCKWVAFIAWVLISMPICSIRKKVTAKLRSSPSARHSTDRATWVAYTPLPIRFLSVGHAPNVKKKLERWSPILQPLSHMMICPPFIFFSGLNPGPRRSLLHQHQLQAPPLPFQGTWADRLSLSTAQPSSLTRRCRCLVAQGLQR